MSNLLISTRQHRSAYNASKRNFKIKFYYLLISGSGSPEFNIKKQLI